MPSGLVCVRDHSTTVSLHNPTPPRFPSTVPLHHGFPPRTQGQSGSLEVVGALKPTVQYPRLCEGHGCINLPANKEGEGCHPSDLS
ncbi:unnamed protein product [Darwinula stevensoni]|uniref:Uncharacterized protein n=1 Tax=Darwinula stevensoni TaxID=69355 RepID=A0A7R9FTA2_9CRUS|nr:unnamed protein product [Darwinula stevensoni]CAG0904975.1 unnamed protein product [Darwinula stevensoni]